MHPIFLCFYLKISVLQCMDKSIILMILSIVMTVDNIK